MMQLPTPNRHPILRHYLRDVVAWHGYIRFVGMSIYKSSPDIPLDTLYVGQSISERHLPCEEEPDRAALHSPSKVLAEHKRLVILGDPGCGKSTLINYYCWFLASGLNQKLPGGLDQTLPIPLVLRDLNLSSINSFDDLLGSFLKRPVAEKLKGGIELLKQYLAAGRAFVMVDGLDEVGLGVRKKLKKVLLEGIEHNPESFFLFTSRIVGYDAVPLGNDASLQSVMLNAENALTGGAITCEPQALTPLAPVTWYMAPLTDERIGQFAKQWYLSQSDEKTGGSLQKRFVDAVLASKDTSTLARIPNLLTMMALIYKVRSELPNGRAILYEHITQAYLESIDTARGFKDSIPWQKKKTWLARVGFEMQLKREDNVEPEDEQLLATTQQVHQWILAAMAQTGDEPDEKVASEYLDWITRRSGLLLPRGEGQYAFMHLSFQEYFAAFYIKHQMQNPDWLDGEEEVEDSALDMRVTKKVLNEWSELSYWSQTLIFLFELFDGQPGWTKRLVKLCFWLKEKDMFTKTNQELLVFSLLANPHAGLHGKLRETVFKQYIDSWNGFNRFAIGLALSGELQHELLSQIEKYIDGRNKLSLVLLSGANADVIFEKLVQYLKPKFLFVASSPIKKINFLAQCEWLEIIALFNCDVTDLTPLNKLPNLKSVTLDKKDGQIIDGLEDKIEYWQSQEP